MHSAAAPDETTTHCIDQVQGEEGEHRFRRFSRLPPPDNGNGDKDKADSAADGDCDPAPVIADTPSAVGGDGHR